MFYRLLFWGNDYLSIFLYGYLLIVRLLGLGSPNDWDGRVNWQTSCLEQTRVKPDAEVSVWGQVRACLSRSIPQCQRGEGGSGERWHALHPISLSWDVIPHWCVLSSSPKYCYMQWKPSWLFTSDSSLKLQPQHCQSKLSFSLLTLSSHVCITSIFIVDKWP